MALNKTLPGLVLLRVRSSTQDPKSTQIPLRTPQAFFLAACTQQLTTARDFFRFSALPQFRKHHSFSYEH